MNCSYCNTMLPESANFCPGCGRRQTVPFCDICKGFHDGEAPNTCLEKILDNTTNFKTILDNALDPFIITNNKGIVVYWNTAATKMLGYSIEEAVGEELLTLIIHDSYNEAYIEVFKNFKETGQCTMFEQTIERPLLKKDRSMIFAEISFSTLSYGTNLFVVGSIRDITHRKQFEEQVKLEHQSLETRVEQTSKELELSQKRYQNLFMHMVEGIEINELIFNENNEPVDFKVLDVNPSYEKITGISKARAIGASGKELYSAENLDFNFYKKLIEDDKAFNLTKESKLLNKNLRMCFFHLENNKFAVVFNDITDQVQAENKLKLTQRSVDNATLPIFWLNNTGKLTYANNETCRKLGYSRDELLNMYVYDIDKNISKEEWPFRFKNRLKESDFSIETIHTRKDGTEIPVLLNGNTVEYEGVMYIHAYIVDLRISKENEKIKENFIATLSHDLRVPLLAENMTLKYFQKGTYGQLTNKQQEAIDNMLESNADLLNLVNTLLDVYKYDSQSITISREWVNINDLIKRCIIELSPLANGHKSIKYEINSNEKTSFFVDKKLIKRVLINIISNAINYSKENSSIEIKTIVKKDIITISIKDYGAGIYPEELNKIFDRYYTNTKKFRKVGTGLGLYLSKQIIDAHGGNIQVKSELNKGSTFYINLPISQ